MKNQILYCALSILFFSGCKTNPNQFIDYRNDKIEYMGRIGKTDSKAEIYWSGSSVRIAFEGTSVSAVLQDEKGDNYFNIILDEDSLRVLRPDTIKNVYLIAENLPAGRHTVQLFKRTEWTKGKTSFYGFRLDGSAKVINIPSKERSIEFYGNSITCGYAVEDYSGKDSPDSIFTNNYNSYAAMTARHFNAEYSCISRSGIGITVSWFQQIMPEMSNLLDPSNPESLWDFSKAAPDIVVINLFQNDSWIVNMPDPQLAVNFFKFL